MVDLSYKLLSGLAEAPYLATSGSACMDVKACLADGAEVKYYSNTYHQAQTRNVEGGIVRFEKGDRIMVPTGLVLMIPENYCVRVYNRSGNAIKKGFQLCNSVGIIDSDYRNEVMILLYNSGLDTFINHGDRIAQLELSPVIYPSLIEVDAVLEAGTERSGGFGSTGR
jgi:dUTP pyrophosphatase